MFEDPQIEEFLKRFALSEQQKRSLQMQKLSDFGFGMMGARKGQELQAVGRAGLAAGEGYRRNTELAQQENMNRLQMTRYAQRMAEDARKQKAADDLRQRVAQTFRAPNLSAMGQGGPTPANAAAAQSPNYAGLRDLYAEEGMSEDAKRFHDISQSGRKQLDKWDVVTDEATGKRVLVKIFKDGTHEVLRDLGPDKPKLNFTNAGGRAGVGQDPFTGAEVSPGVPMTQSPDNKASTAVSWANYNLAKQREAREAASEKRGPGGTVDTERGIVIDPRSATARAVTLDGKPLGQKPSASARKEVEEIDAQLASIAGAKSAAKETPSAFGFWRGVATRMGANAEALVGATDSEAETIARSYVFNNVSKIINERAGAAQSVQELARLRSFLPAESDRPDKIVQKLEAFERYLRDRRGGYGAVTAAPASANVGTIDFSQLPK
jgi:hypothetical protein